MQETRNSCFRSKKRSTTIRQAKTGKYECRNVHCCYISALVLTWFHLTKGRAAFFRPKTIISSFLHLMMLLFKVLLNLSSKHKFLLLHCRRIVECQIYGFLCILFLILLIKEQKYPEQPLKM